MCVWCNEACLEKMIYWINVADVSPEMLQNVAIFSKITDM